MISAKTNDDYGFVNGKFVGNVEAAQMAQTVQAEHADVNQAEVNQAQVNHAEVKPAADNSDNSEKSDNAQPEKSTTEQAQEIAGRALESGVAVGDVSDNSDKTWLDKAGEALDNFADKAQEVGKDIAVGAGEVAGELAMGVLGIQKAHAADMPQHHTQPENTTPQEQVKLEPQTSRFPWTDHEELQKLQEQGLVDKPNGGQAENQQTDAPAVSATAPKTLERHYVDKDGNVTIKQGGSRSWRNNNSGNLEYGKFAKKYGAIGTDGRFAIFPDEKTGDKAREVLVFGGDKFKNVTLKEAIKLYAPPGENDTERYYKTIKNAVGVEKIMKDYSPSERQIILNAMKKHEGYKVGKVIKK